ncbi:MAG: RnfABCDGE type electron transport complex subunit G [Bacteroidaceae bacterium]|nr:RnfABCDGE type electron transport complex subunit G [Bacteroidaceae bacterium]
MKKLKSSITNMALVLTVISVIAGGSLAAVNEITKDPIAKINKKNLDDGIKKVLLGSTEGELKVQAPWQANETTLIYATDKGTAVQASVNGFGGELRVLVGFDEAGTIKGYTILQSSETPGLGTKADTWFQEGGKGCIIGKNPEECNLTVTKDGGDIDAITASTITSRAFLRAVQAAYDAYKGSDADTGASVKKHD